MQTISIRASKTGATGKTRILSLSISNTSINWDRCRMQGLKEYRLNKFKKVFFISHQLWMKEIFFRQEALPREALICKSLISTKSGNTCLWIDLIKWGGLLIHLKLVVRSKIILKLIKCWDFSLKGLEQEMQITFQAKAPVAVLQVKGRSTEIQCTLLKLLTTPWVGRQRIKLMQRRQPGAKIWYQSPPKCQEATVIFLPTKLQIQSTIICKTSRNHSNPPTTAYPWNKSSWCSARSLSLTLLSSITLTCIILQ